MRAKNTINYELHSSLGGGLGGLGGLAGNLALLNLFDNTDGNGLSHVTDSEAAEWWVLGEHLDNHGLLWLELNHSGITGLDALRVVLSGLTGTLVDLGADLLELAGNMGGVAIQNWSVTIADLTWMVQDDDLGNEHGGVLGGVLLGVGANVASLDVLNGQVLDVEADVVTWGGLLNLLVMHLDGLDLGGGADWAEGDDHTGLDDTSLDTADWHSSDTANLVDVLEWETEGLVNWALWWVNVVEGLEEDWSLVPWHVLRSVDHVVTVPAGNWDELNLGGVVADLLEVGGRLSLDFLVALLRVLDGTVVHLVDGDDHLTDTHGLGKKSVLTGLTLGGETSLELTTAGGNHEDGGVSLGGTSDHVLDEISVAWGINDGEDSLGGLELPESNIDGDTTLTFGLELIQNPGVLEGTLTHLVGLLLELLDGTGIDTTALVDQVTSGGGLAGIDVTNDDQVKSVLLFLLSNDISHVVKLVC